MEMKDQVVDTLAATDQDMTRDIAPKRPEVAPLIDVPPHKDRYTIHVPSEDTTLSLGQKSDKKPYHVNDLGITGRTDNHVHLHVQKETKTVVSLGGPATSVEIDSQDAKVPKESKGYAMVTDENAWHDAKLQHYLVSRTKDIVVRAVGPAGDATALLQSDLGAVVIGAGQAVAVGAQGSVKIAGHTGIPMETKEKYDTPVARDTVKDFDEKLKSAASACVEAVKSVYDALKDVIKDQKKKPVWKKPDWSDVSAAEVQPILAAATALHDARKDLLKPETTGTVDIIAEKDASVLADKVQIHGTTGVCISTGEAADVAGKNATLKATEHAGMWGKLHASVRSGGDASIEAEAGELTMQASKDVSIASETMGVIVQGDTDVQLNGKTGSAFVHGHTATYLGAGQGAGYGLKAEAGQIQVGKMGAADDFGGPAPVETENLTIGGGKLTGTFADSTVEMKSGQITMNSPHFVVNAGGQGAEITGSRILLG